MRTRDGAPDLKPTLASQRTRTRCSEQLKCCTNSTSSECAAERPSTISCFRVYVSMYDQQEAYQRPKCHWRSACGDKSGLHRHTLTRHTCADMFQDDILNHPQRGRLGYRVQCDAQGKIMSQISPVSSRHMQREFWRGRKVRYACVESNEDGPSDRNTTATPRKIACEVRFRNWRRHKCT